jgi:hypothetical protein
MAAKLAIFSQTADGFLLKNVSKDKVRRERGLDVTLERNALKRNNG